MEAESDGGVAVAGRKMAQQAAAEEIIAGSVEARRRRLRPRRRLRLWPINDR